MDLALVGSAVRSKPAAFVAAVGRSAVLAVGAAGFTVGFFLWYAVALRSPHGPLFLNGTWAVCLVVGIVGVYAGWIGYGRYFARRARVDEITALQYDAVSWAALVVLWGTLLAPSGTHGTGRAVAVAVGGFVLAKLVVAARFNRTVREVALTFLDDAPAADRDRGAGVDGDRSASGRALRRVDQPAARGVGPLGRRALPRHRAQRLLRHRAGVLPALPAADPHRRRRDRLAARRRACSSRTRRASWRCCTSTSSSSTSTTATSRSARPSTSRSFRRRSSSRPSTASRCSCS